MSASLNPRQQRASDWAWPNQKAVQVEDDPQRFPPLTFKTKAFFFFFFNKFIIYLFIYFWLCWVFVAARGLSLVVVSGGLLFVAVHGLLIAVASLVAEHGLYTLGLQ